jgi:kinesin family protein 18/19
MTINDIIRVDEGRLITVINPDRAFSKEKSFEFDEVLTPSTTNCQVFDTALRPFLEQYFEKGYNTTCFAYGITGSGKTHTIFGDIHERTIEQPGLCFLACDYLFDQMKRNPQKFAMSTIKFSYLEIYNEHIRDLLSDNDKNYMIIEDPIKGIVIQDMTEFEVDDVNELKELIMTGNERRSLAATMINEYSSRSHALLQFSVEFLDPAT